MDMGTRAALRCWQRPACVLSAGIAPPLHDFDQQLHPPPHKHLYTRSAAGTNMFACGSFTVSYENNDGSGSGFESTGYQAPRYVSRTDCQLMLSASVGMP